MVKSKAPSLLHIFSSLFDHLVLFLSVAKKNPVNHISTLKQIFGTKKYLVTFWNRLESRVNTRTEDVQSNIRSLKHGYWLAQVKVIIWLVWSKHCETSIEIVVSFICNEISGVKTIFPHCAAWGNHGKRSYRTLCLCTPPKSSPRKFLLDAHSQMEDTWCSKTQLWKKPD